MPTVLIVEVGKYHVMAFFPGLKLCWLIKTGRWKALLEESSMKMIFLALILIMLTGCSVYSFWFGSKKAVLTSIRIEGVLDETGQVTEVKISDELSTASASSAPSRPLEPLESFPSAASKLSSSNSSSSTRSTHIGAVIAWSPDFNAAFISGRGKGCIQPALYAQMGSGSIDIPTSILTKGLDSEGNLRAEYASVLEKFIKVSDQSTFLSMGLYGLCQMHANGGLTNEQLKDLTNELFKKAASLGNIQSSSASAASSSSAGASEVSDT